MGELYINSAWPRTMLDLARGVSQTLIFSQPDGRVSAVDRCARCIVRSTALKGQAKKCFAMGSYPEYHIETYVCLQKRTKHEWPKKEVEFYI